MRAGPLPHRSDAASIAPARLPLVGPPPLLLSCAMHCPDPPSLSSSTWMQRWYPPLFSLCPTHRSRSSTLSSPCLSRASPSCQSKWLPPSRPPGPNVHLQASKHRPSPAFGLRNRHHRSFSPLHSDMSFLHPTLQINGPPSPLLFSQSCGSTPCRCRPPWPTGHRCCHRAPLPDKPRHRQGYSMSSHLLGIARCDFLSPLMLALASIPLLITQATVGCHATVRGDHGVAALRYAGEAGWLGWFLQLGRVAFRPVASHGLPGLGGCGLGLVSAQCQCFSFFLFFTSLNDPRKFVKLPKFM
jgi:hypothetical protein